MTFHQIMQIPEQPARTDKAAMGAIHRLLRMAGLFCSSALCSQASQLFSAMLSLALV